MSRTSAAVTRAKKSPLLPYSLNFSIIPDGPLPGRLAGSTWTVASGKALCTPVSATAGNVVWQLDYTWANPNGTFGAPATMTSDATAAGGTAWVHKISTLKDGSGNAYIAGAGKTISSMLVCRLHRNAGAGADTLAADAAFLEFDIHYEVDAFGSRQEYIK